MRQQPQSYKFGGRLIEAGDASAAQQQQQPLTCRTPVLEYFIPLHIYAVSEPQIIIGYRKLHADDLCLIENHFRPNKCASTKLKIA